MIRCFFCHRLFESDDVLVKVVGEKNRFVHSGCCAHPEKKVRK